MKNNILIILFFTSLLMADNASFEKWQNQEAESFERFQSTEDRKFMKFLKEWEWYQEGKSPNYYYKQKLQKQPIKESIVINKEYNLITKPKPIITPIIKDDSFINFFGNQIPFTYSKKVVPPIEQPSVGAVGHFWKYITKQNYQKIVNELQIYQSKYRLNGWATYILIQKITKQMSSHINTQNLLQWFFLLKMGIDTKVGINKTKIVLMIYSQDIIYATHYFTINNKRYFILNSTSSTSSLRIYKQGDRNLLALNFLGQYPILKQKVKKRRLNFRFKEKSYTIPFYYNQNLIDFYGSYPQIQYNYYTQMDISNQTSQTISKTLKNIISSMNQHNAINFLLRLTQTGFNYQRDHTQFGKEKVMFFEESLAYPYSDCEDRAIFFTHLVKKLLHLDILFVKYPNHLATAISINTNIKGDNLIYHNKKYYIADPTYSQSNIGQAMPKMKGIKFKIIEP